MWICRFFGESVGQKFVEEEIDGQALLSKRFEEDSTLDKLGATTIGKKERFSRELMAIKPVVNGKYSSLAKLFFNLLFNSKPSSTIFGKAGVKSMQYSEFSCITGTRYTESIKSLLELETTCNLRTVNVIILLFS